MKNLTTNEKGQMFYAGSLVLTAKDGSIFYVSTEMLVIKAYRAKAKKPFMNYRYKNLDRLKASVTNSINACNSSFEEKAKRKAESKKRVIEFREKLEVGTILYTCWGYEQTNVEFYQVVSKAGAYCEVREIAKRSQDTAYMQSEVTPKPNTFIGEPMRKKIMDGYIVIHNSANASPLEYEELATGTKVYKRCHTSSYC